MTNNLPPATGLATPGRYAADTMLTLAEIAGLLGRDPKTIKTRRDKGKGRWPNAVQDATGRRARRESRETKALREQVIRLEEQLAAARTLAEERAATITLLKGLVRKGGAV